MPNQFGKYSAKRKGYQVTAAWQASLGQAANVGSFFGIWIGAYLVDRVGYKYTILGGLAFICPIIAMTTFAPNKGVLLAGELICGLPWGIL
jgi:SP family general alpha glucoside:H+ symporter-like MFS transporter